MDVFFLKIYSEFLEIISIILKRVKWTKYWQLSDLQSLTVLTGVRWEQIHFWTKAGAPVPGTGAGMMSFMVLLLCATETAHLQF